MKIPALAAVLLLSGCAARLLPPGISGNEAFVTVSNVWNDGEALPYATRHCAQYGKIPRLQQSNGYSFTFDCVAR